MDRPGEDDRSAGGLRLSLRAKGLLAFATLIVYALALAAFVAHERGKLRASVDELARLTVLEQKLSRLAMSVTEAGARAAVLRYEHDRAAGANELRAHIQSVVIGLADAEPQMPIAGPLGIRLVDVADRSHYGSSLYGTLAIQDELGWIGGQLDGLAQQLGERRAALAESYRSSYAAITLVWLVLGLLGVVLIGAVVTLFFTRLALDIKALEARAAEIVRGYRGEPLQLDRNDEVGALAGAVNRMAAGLDEHERALEISRQKAFHHEKILTVSTLAAGVAHEINNPIAAIVGAAQAIRAACDAGQCPDKPVCQADLIMDQAHRVAGITRAMSGFGSPRRGEPEWYSLNEAVRSTCDFIRFDQRFRGIALNTDLEPSLPAVYGTRNLTTQVLLNLLVNAADAVEADGARPGSVTVATRVEDDRVLVLVADSGCGMSADVCARAFDMYFTTKPDGKGTGLGLPLSKALVEEAGGTIELQSVEGRGTTVSVRLPIASPTMQGAAAEAAG